MHLPSDQPQYDESSGRPRPRHKRADIQERKLLIGISVVVGLFGLFGLSQANPSGRKILLLWLVGVIAFYYCFAKLIVYSYNRDKQKLRDRNEQPPQ